MWSKSSWEPVANNVKIGKFYWIYVIPPGGIYVISPGYNTKIHCKVKIKIRHYIHGFYLNVQFPQFFVTGKKKSNISGK